MRSYVCDHCLIEVNEKEVLFDQIEGQDKVFCCSGCKGIYHLLHDQGLDTFYSRRTGWQPGPPELLEVSTGIFNDHVRSIDGSREIDITISGIRCASCIWLIEHFLKRFDGIDDVRVNYATHGARIRWNPQRMDLDRIVNAIISIGYTPHPWSPSIREELLKKEKKDLLIRFGTAVFFSMQLMLYTVALYAGYFMGIEPHYRKVFQFIAWGLATPVMFYSGFPFLKNTLSGIRNRTVSMDTLIFMGSFSAYAYSVFVIFTHGDVYFDTSAMIITLILLGRFIEAGAKGKASEAISKLMGLQPKEARLVQRSAIGGRPSKEIKMVPVSDIQIGDTIEVIPGDTIPIDADVIDGSSDVDESMLTGESMPVQKSKGSDVYGGTTNLNGLLIMRVLKTGKDTVLTHIIKTVEDAQARKAPIQTIADSVVRWFVPAIIIISLLTFIAWLRISNDATHALMNAIAVLVIACPCALGLATPLAILMGSTVSSARGIMIRGGDILETAGRTVSIFVDKTGTITEGKPSLEDIIPFDIDKRELHLLAASLEKSSEHIIARALRDRIDHSELRDVGEFEAYPGMGISGAIDGKRAIAGNIGFIRENNIEVTAEQQKIFDGVSSQGKTVIGFALDNALKGWLVISDRLRKEANETITTLNNAGYDIHLVTGDHSNVAEHIASEAGIRPDSIHSEVSPIEKATIIRNVKSSGRKVMMVGDGINDAPALTEADVGVSFGKATDIAIQSADAVLMKSDLKLVPMLLDISHETLGTIKQNLFWAFSYNLITIPLAVTGKIHPIVSAALMAISSLIVVGNSLRLKRLQSKGKML
jgi:Cu2+-exporting ATPase